MRPVADDPVFYALRIVALIGVLLVIALLVTACASDRYLSKSEDTELRAKCEATGCAVIPMPLWQRIEKLIQSMRGA